MELGKCSKCGKTGIGQTGWIKLVEEDLKGYFSDNDSLGYYFLCPKCRADMLGSLTQFISKTKIEQVEVPGWKYQKADDLPWEPQYSEDTETYKYKVNEWVTAELPPQTNIKVLDNLKINCINAV